MTATITFQMQVLMNLSLLPESKSLSSIMLGHSVLILVAVSSHKYWYACEFPDAYSPFIHVKKSQKNEWACWLKKRGGGGCSRLCKDAPWAAEVIYCQVMQENCHICLTWKNYRRSACGWFEVTLAYTWRDWGKPQNTSVIDNVVSILAEILTGHLKYKSEVLPCGPSCMVYWKEHYFDLRFSQWWLRRVWYCGL
jgi:hypothetical protein